MVVETEKKSRPIIMSADSVRAILAGRKTQTRRVVKPQPKWIGQGARMQAAGMNALLCYAGGKLCSTADCPYGVPGDLLRVRESWRVVGWHEGEPLRIEYRDGATADENSDYVDDATYEAWYERIITQCCHDCREAGLELNSACEYSWETGQAPTRWRSPHYMPRWASRLWLRVVKVRVQSVQEISEDDAYWEGARGQCECVECCNGEHAGQCKECAGWGYGETDDELCEHCNGEGTCPRCDGQQTCRNAFRNGWDSLNAKRGHPWSNNDSVWAVTFEQAEKPG